jgi:hypothetical protein
MTKNTDIVIGKKICRGMWRKTMSKIEVDRQKYLLMCIDILKSPDGMVNPMTKEFAEEEILRLSQ